MGNYYAGIMNSEAGRELRHHGILGQKWGIRRFQNPDGSLTPAGRERYGYSSKKKTADEVAKNGMAGRTSLKNLFTSIAYNTPRKEDSLSSRETRKLQSYMQGRDDMAQKYKMVTEAAAEMNKARKQVPPLKENSKTYKELRNRAIDESADYYVREFGLSKDEARKWASEEEEILKDEIDRAYLSTSQHPAAKAYREKRETYLDLHRDLSNDVDETIRTTLGSNLNLAQKSKATRAIYDAMIEKTKSQSSEIPKTGFFKKSNGSRPDGSPRPGASTYAEDYGEKEFQKSHSKYMRGIGTEGILYGNRTNDPSVKVLDKFRSEQKSIGKVDKSARKEKTRALESKYSKSYAEALLKSMGYDVNPGSIGWIMKQPWFSVEKDANTLSFNRIMSPSTVNTAAANAIANNRNR